MEDFIKESVKRLEVRIHFSTLIIREQQNRQKKGTPFNICDNQTWEDTRFARIRHKMAEKLSEPSAKQKFI